MKNIVNKKNIKNTMTVIKVLHKWIAGEILSDDHEHDFFSMAFETNSLFIEISRIIELIRRLTNYGFPCGIIHREQEMQIFLWPGSAPSPQDAAPWPFPNPRCFLSSTCFCLSYFSAVHLRFFLPFYVGSEQLQNVDTFSMEMCPLIRH